MEENKKCIGGYYRIRKGKREDPEKTYRNLQRGYGTKHPEKINGYMGLFFGKGDVFVSANIADRMEMEDFRSFVYESLRMYEKEGYGDISQDDIDLNGENRWLGNGDGVTGRYGFYREGRYLGKERYDEVIRIRTWKGNIWISYDSEPDRFLLLKENREDPEPEKSGTPAEKTAEPQPDEKDGIEFLKEYRAHSEKYLPMSRRQYAFVTEKEGDRTNLFWNAGIIEDNRPFFAVCWKMFHVTSLDIYVSADGMENWDSEHLFVPKMIRRGLLEVDDVRKIPPAAFRQKDAAGHEFYMIDLVLDDEKPAQNIRWIGKKYTFDELNRFNMGLE